jgi:hypothetical protein
MRLQPPPLRHDQRLAGVGITVALHLALLYAWHSARQSHATSDDGDAPRVQWVKVQAPRSARQAPAVPRAVVKPKAAPRQATLATHPAPAAVAAPAAISSPVVDAPPTRSAAEMMQQAKKDLGKIDQELRKEFPGPRIKAPPDSPQIRLVKGIEEAAELAPPEWYQPAKVKEIIDPGPYGRKRYRITTAFGTYCTTYDSSHTPNGIDSMKNGIQPKHTNCAKNEAPATTQKWDQ